MTRAPPEQLALNLDPDDEDDGSFAYYITHHSLHHPPDPDPPKDTPEQGDSR